MAVAQELIERHRKGIRLVVVVSAMGDATDGLLALAHALVDSPPQRELDMLVTAGERISMALLCMCVDKLGGRAKSFTGSQSGIVTENAHQGARIIAIRPQRIHDALDAGNIVIVAGYQGVSIQGEITTLGRGGSDTTAVALGAALGASQIDIFSDVDGVYTADPRVCPQARHLSEISYQLMGKMACFGAQVLHDQAVDFARRAGITLVAKKTGAPNGPSTRMGPEVRLPEATMAVTTLARCFWLTGGAAAHLPALLSGLSQINLRMVAMGGGAALCVSHVAAGQNHLGAIGSVLPSPWQSRPVSAVTLVGLTNMPAWLPRAIEALGQAKIEVFDAWGEPEALTIAVPCGLGGLATQALHTLIPT